MDGGPILDDECSSEWSMNGRYRCRWDLGRMLQLNLYFADVEDWHTIQLSMDMRRRKRRRSASSLPRTDRKRCNIGFARPMLAWIGS